jgi:bud site selection protein 20
MCVANFSRVSIVQWVAHIWLLSRYANTKVLVREEIAKKKMRLDEGGMEEEETVLPEFDPELPGGGRFYCLETARHFVSQDALEKHKASKQFKKRAKELEKEKSYTHESVEGALGISKEVLPAL